MTNRQPKGTPVGGQFAEGRKPDGGDLTIMTASGVVIAESRHVDINDQSEHRSLDAGNMCLFCGRSSGFVNRAPADRTSDDGSINVTGYVCAECDGCEDDATFRHCPECDDITAGNDDGICSSCGEEQDEDTSDIPLNIPRSLCTQCTGETNFDFDAFAFELQNDTLMTAPGNQYGEISIGQWINDSDSEVVLQVLPADAETFNDYEGWTVRGVAQVLKERGIRTATVSDVLNIFSDGGGDVLSVAFDDGRGINQTMLEIDGSLKGMS